MNLLLNRLPGILEMALLPDRTTPRLYGIGRDALYLYGQRTSKRYWNSDCGGLRFVTNFFEDSNRW